MYQALCQATSNMLFSSSWLPSEEHSSPAPTPDLSTGRLSQAVRGRRKNGGAPPWTLKMQTEKGGWGVAEPLSLLPFLSRELRPKGRRAFSGTFNIAIAQSHLAAS